MESIKRYIPFFTSAFIMCVLLMIICPYYKYYVDPDAVAYLTIAKRYAKGDIANAINGYWSPWSCWLVALMIKSGFDDLISMVIINSIGAIGLLYISQSFFLKYGLVKKLQWALNITLALFLCYAIFWQSFDDIWECFFLLAALRVMLNDKFSTSPALWTLTGITGTLAYFAKAYAFPFFILNVTCCTYLIDRKQWLKISATIIFIMVFCSSGWIYLLHQKYGIWTTSTAGTLNMSWYLVGHPHFKEGITHLVPPHNTGSPYYWEDPWSANGDRPQFWSSGQLFGRQILKGGYNFLKFIVCILQLSVLFPFIIWLAVKLLGSLKTKMLFPDKISIVALSFLLFPLAYMLINFEPRYLWYMLPLAMVMGGLYLQNKFGSKKQSFDFFITLFAVSFLIIPAAGMKKLYKIGRAHV